MTAFLVAATSRLLSDRTHCFDSFLKLGHPHLELLIGLSLVGDLLLEPAELGDKTLGERLQLLSAALDDLLGDPVVEQDVAYTLHEGRYDGGESHVCGLGAMSRKKEQASTWKAELLAAETTDCDCEIYWHFFK